MKQIAYYTSLVKSLAALYFVLSAALRFILWWQIGEPEGVAVSQLPLLMTAGLANDVAGVVYVTVPLTFAYVAAPLAAESRWLTRWFNVAAIYGWLFATSYLFFVEYFFFEEFESRFNLVAVDYLRYPHEVFVNIWDSYPVGTVVATVAAASAALCAGMWARLRRRAAARPGRRTRVALAIIHAGLLTVIAVLVPRDSLLHAANRVANEIAINGVTSFLEALSTNELDYTAHYYTANPAELKKILRRDLATAGGELVPGDRGSVMRTFPERKHGLGRLNVVVIVEESFGAEYVGAYGDTRELTPTFDQLASQGLLFRHTYATGTRTVRGLEAVTLSFPPIPSEAVVKRPGGEHMASWGAVMREHGYHTSFLYGGYSYFDNMRTFYAGNGFHVSDRSEIDEQSFANIWGVCDGDLFRHAHQYFNKVASTAQPFFSIIMTTSNHKPFTFPPGIPGVPESGGGREAGIRYADHALGQFFAAIGTEDWFTSTLFVVVADHGARVYGRDQIPLRSYEIPLLILAPSHLTPARLEAPASQIDVAPTVLGLLGLKYHAPFFGRDLMNGGASAHRPLLLNHNHDVALMQDGRLVVLGLGNRVDYLAYDDARHELTATPPDFALRNLAAAYYQLAYSEFNDGTYR